ncbi:fungal specific transcription factor domain-containing protein [Trichoderma breve]|uniref:Fungal specific transcription factor domain-containing protein n=1 Tax=Trichoderma breve TaxID=2034170 RepID=A0A9W9B759_9HYPO|nr:fungal specific transcription factor domain-containing protein [Trichoderma breve]KAJ4854713.1 fungal specific transcription factor domain-containing protein [Trichoderma breve]
MEHIVDTGESDRSGRPSRVTKRKKRPPLSCTECRRRKRKCDGKLPCCDCKLRDKPQGCRYADGAMPRNRETASPYSSAATMSIHSPMSVTGTISLDSDSSKGHQIDKLGYARTGTSTADYLDRIDVGDDEVVGELEICPTASGHGNLWERYKSLVKQLPTRECITKLTDFYFQKINWQYYILDESSFRQQLHNWYQLDLQPFAAKKFEVLPADMKAFPALLLEVAATSLLLMTPDRALELNDLKNVSGMSFETMAVKYSETGMALLNLLGKLQISLTTVFADFLRVAFLKYFGQVTESWHALGEAVKDAQEIGLHRASRDPKPHTDDIAIVIENQWNIQDRRRLWMLLSGWDIHTAMVLGRPAAIDDNTEPILPVDVPITANRPVTPVMPRGADDVPTPLTRAIWAYRIMKNLRQIQALEKEGSYPEDYSHVDRLDQELRQLDQSIPPYFRRHNPDKGFDSIPECYWLSGARATVPQLLSFDMMALHRPYIFTRPESRSRALEACLDMLQAQREHFESIEENQYKTFFLFFGTFDAIVLIASIYTFFPTDHLDKAAQAMQHFQWSTERFEAMSGQSALAKAAAITLRTFSTRLKKTLQWEACYPSVDALSTSTNTPGSHMQAKLDGLASYSDAISSCSDTGLSPSGSKMQLRFPNDGPPVALYDLSSIEPIYATSDIVYNDLFGSLDLQTPFSPDSNPCLPQFHGNFSSNSIWSFLNNDFDYANT